MRTLRSVIVDDEPLARKLLRSMLEEHSDVEVVAEFADGDEAVIGIRRIEPDLVFLDVQMPKRNGMEVLRELGPDRDTEIVFVTAYDQYALRAFEVNAVDYLLKPFDEERLGEALERVRARLVRPERGDYQDRLSALIEQLGTPYEHVERIAVKRGEKIFLQPVRDVELFDSEGKYVRIYAGAEEYLIRETMVQLGQILDPRRFIRISRSAIVNIDHIREIQPWFRGDYVVTLTSGRHVNTTKSYRDSLKNLIDRVG